MTAQQHANWKAQARVHLRENNPRQLAKLIDSGKLDQHLTDAADSTSKEMKILMDQGATWQEAWEMTRENHLFPPGPEGPEDVPAASAGYKAQRELMQGMTSLQLPGER